MYGCIFEEFCLNLNKLFDGNEKEYKKSHTRARTHARTHAHTHNI